MGASTADQIATVLDSPPYTVTTPLIDLRGVSDRVATYYHREYGRPNTEQITIGDLIRSEGALTTPAIPYGWHRKAGIDLASADVHPTEIGVATEADRVLAQFSTAVGPSWTLDDGDHTVPPAPAIHDWDYRWDRSWKVWRLDGTDVTYDPTDRVTAATVTPAVTVDGTPYHVVSTADLAELTDSKTRATATTYRVSRTSLVLASVLLGVNYTMPDAFNRIKLLPEDIDDADIVHGEYDLAPPVVFEAPELGVAFASTVVSTTDAQLAACVDDLLTQSTDDSTATDPPPDAQTDRTPDP